MKSYDHGPNLPDGVPIDQVRLRPFIKRALAAAGLRTVGDVRKASDAMLLSIQVAAQPDEEDAAAASVSPDGAGFPNWDIPAGSEEIEQGFLSLILGVYAAFLPTQH
jgi:hypothetical protein